MVDTPVASISGVISRLSLPAPLIIVSQGPHSLGLGVSQVFVTPSISRLLCSSLDTAGVSVFSVDQFHRTQLVWPAIVVISGSQYFFSRLQCHLQAHSGMIWSHEQLFCGSHYQQCSKRLGEVSHFCRASNLKSVQFRHSAYGGATNAIHLVAFSPSLASAWKSFRHPPNVCRSICHAWNPAAQCPGRVCLEVPLAETTTFPKPLFWNKSLRVKGLLHACHTFQAWVPNSSVFGPR